MTLNESKIEIYTDNDFIVNNIKIKNKETHIYLRNII